MREIFQNAARQKTPILLEDYQAVFGEWPNYSIVYNEKDGWIRKSADDYQSGGECIWGSKKMITQGENPVSVEIKYPEMGDMSREIEVLFFGPDENIECGYKLKLNDDQIQVLQL